MPTVHIVAPSHFHPDATCPMSLEIYKQHGFVIEAHIGICNFSKHSQEVLRRHLATGNKVIWVVIDWRCGNYDYEKVGTFPDTPSRPGNIDRQFITPEIDALLITKQRALIHDMLNEFPGQIHLLFWCAFVRTILGVSWPEEGKYDSLVEEFAQSVIDVKPFFPTLEALQESIVDTGGHMNALGHSRMLQCLLERFPELC